MVEVHTVAARHKPDAGQSPHTVGIESKYEIRKQRCDLMYT